MQNIKFPIATSTPLCCSSHNVMCILRQTAILWDNSLGLKSSCKVNLALPSLPQAYLPLFFLVWIYRCHFPTVLSLFWRWTNNQEVNPHSCLGQLCLQLDGDHTDEKLISMDKKPTNLHSPSTKNIRFMQDSSRHHVTEVQEPCRAPGFVHKSCSFGFPFWIFPSASCDTFYYNTCPCCRGICWSHYTPIKLWKKNASVASQGTR